MNFKYLIIVILLLLPQILLADSYSYNNISKRFPTAKMDNKSVKEAKMEGECLVGLKELNFKKKDKFDAVAEWTNYRSISLLQHYSPCEVLIIMEVAKSKISNRDHVQ